LTPENQYRRFAELALAMSDDCIKIIDLDGALLHINDGGRRVMEIEDFETVRGCPWPDFWKDQGNRDARAAIENARNGKASHFTGFADTAKGRRRFWDVKVAPIFDPFGKVEKIISVSRDITYQKDFEEQQSILRNELAHRIKNIIAMVQSVVNQTLKDGELVSDVKPVINARLAALGRAHDLLMKTRRGMTTLTALAATTVQEQAEGYLVGTGCSPR
jgi:PAS domain S-box-containing protein